MTDNPYWSTRELAEAATKAGRPVSQRTIQRLCERGEIEAIRPARDYLIADEAARAWLADFTNTSDDRPG